MKTVTMEELGRAFNIKPKNRASNPKPVKCSKCGATMIAHPMTNIYTCPGEVEQEKEGKKVLVPCSNFLMRNYIIK